ncbi:MAG: carbamoyl-phosphate synthase large subunit [Acidobacteria bacterium]|jgi:carbamoyl-phosphate synthase large subunit|nr:carbamoyl-phosphate synthase large subunit [Acidobacteriota bacterium]
MTARLDAPQSVLVIGSGPIVIGQACEFDYSGVQALKALKEEGIRTILVNNNPATIMTDPGLCDATYLEPIEAWALEAIIEKERPEALLPTVGGQTALNAAMLLHRDGVLERYGCRLIGASAKAIRAAEDREVFRNILAKEGMETSRSFVARSVEEGLARVGEVGFPAILRPSFTLGGQGGGIAANLGEFKSLLEYGLSLSPAKSVLVEESLIGWKEFELEVIRDRADNVVVICSIENLDPMGVHTGDSITVAPAQTLSDKEYQWMRDWAKRVIRAVGVETGGSNIQFALHPRTGRMVVIEMNPRVSRSSALASKATGYPIARVATQLALGYTLDELPNLITRTTPAAFEPALDYVVVKIPRWSFDKFRETDPTLSTHMKSIGEVMAIGRTFKESLQKALRSVEIGRYGLLDGVPPVESREALVKKLSIPNWERVFYTALAFQHGLSVEEVSELSGMDPWFLSQMAQLVETENRLRFFGAKSCPGTLLRRAKEEGFADRRLCKIWDVPESVVRDKREESGAKPVYLGVDTCAAEFEAQTPYFYSSYAGLNESAPLQGRKVVVVGSGPNRVGQGIEFDYCCCQAVFGLKDEGFETVMVNCNPETVSTDFDTASKLYFEPVTLEDVKAILDLEKPDGVILTFGGQTPLKLANELHRLGYPLIGTPPAAIHRAEDREQFGALCLALGLRAPKGATAHTLEEARERAAELGFPLMVRPSYVLGGQGMALLTKEDHLDQYLAEGVAVSEDHPLLLDTFLQDAVELDVDALCDGVEVVLAGILEHVEKAGIHSGDSSQVYPPQTVPREVLDEAAQVTRRVALELGIVGMLNLQFAYNKDGLFVLEVNPRVSRTVPFLSKARKIPFARLAARIMTGRLIKELPELQGLEAVPKKPEQLFVKASVFPFARLLGEDPVLGPEMKSTGEVMGRAGSFGQAFAKALSGAGLPLPEGGAVFLSLRDADKAGAVKLAEGFAELGFALVATHGTRAFLEKAGVFAGAVNKVGEGKPDAAGLLKAGTLKLVINTPMGRKSQRDEANIRCQAIALKVPCITTLEGAYAALEGIRALKNGTLDVKPIQEWTAG